MILSTIPELKNHWNPGNERHLLELDLNPRVLRLLVDFCYNGEIKIDREDDLLLLYIFCGFYNIRALNPLFDEHSTYLNSIENLFLILNQSHYPDEAFIFREKCLKKIVRIIGYVSQMDLFPTLSAKALGEILRHEDLMIDPEDKVLEIFLKWYYKLPKFKLEHDSIDTVRNDPDVKYVLAGIRLPLVHPKVSFCINCKVKSKWFLIEFDYFSIHSNLPRKFGPIMVRNTIYYLNVTNGKQLKMAMLMFEVKLKIFE